MAARRRQERGAPVVSALDLAALQPAEEQQRWPLQPLLRGRAAAVCCAPASSPTEAFKNVVSGLKVMPGRGEGNN